MYQLYCSSISGGIMIVWFITSTTCKFVITGLESNIIVQGKNEYRVGTTLLLFYVFFLSIGQGPLDASVSLISSFRPGSQRIWYIIFFCSSSSFYLRSQPFALTLGTGQIMGESNCDGQSISSHGFSSCHVNIFFETLVIWCVIWFTTVSFSAFIKRSQLQVSHDERKSLSSWAVD
jgi:hypothetical protein